MDEVNDICWAFPSKVSDLTSACECDDIVPHDTDNNDHGNINDDEYREALIDDYYNAYDSCVSGMKDGLFYARVSYSTSAVCAVQV